MLRGSRSYGILLTDHVRHQKIFPLGDNALFVEQLVPVGQLQIFCHGFLAGSVHGLSSILRQYFPSGGFPTAWDYCCVRSLVKKYIADGIGTPPAMFHFLRFQTLYTAMARPAPWTKASTRAARIILLRRRRSGAPPRQHRRWPALPRSQSRRKIPHSCLRFPPFNFR